MVVRGWLDDQPITLSLKQGALTVALDKSTVLALDHAGRLWSFYVAGHHFRRGLNGSVLAKWMHAGARQRRRLWQSESELLVWRASLILRGLRDGLTFETDWMSSSRTGPEVVEQIREILTNAAALNVAAARADVDHYHRVYKPIGILPPDQYLALVLQVTEGCSFNTCSFCTFYRDRPFHIKTAAELRAHIEAVRVFLGKSMQMRRGVFLADANALVIPQTQMIELVDTVSEELREEPQIFAFLDGFSGRKKTAEDYAALAQRGLRRVYVGLESGHDPLLAWVRKPGRANDAVAAIRQMKAGGVHVGLIVMLGLGGERYSLGHVRDTVDAVNQMDLGRGDLLYFSEFVPHGTLYQAEVETPDLSPLPKDQMIAQREAITAALSFGDGRPKIASYDIREFVY